MARDSDVARVAAALRSPGLRYRSFGNEPVRGAPSQSVDESPDSAPLPGKAPGIAMAGPAGAPAAPPSFVPLPADFASWPSPGPVDLSYPPTEPGRPAALPPAAPPEAAPAADPGGLAALLSGVAQAAARAHWPPPLPQTGLLPAGQVTLPLAEVMRLVGGTAPAPASPFAAFRLAGQPADLR